METTLRVETKLFEMFCLEQWQRILSKVDVVRSIVPQLFLVIYPVLSNEVFHNLVISQWYGNSSTSSYGCVKPVIPFSQNRI